MEWTIKATKKTFLGRKEMKVLYRFECELTALAKKGQLVIRHVEPINPRQDRIRHYTWEINIQCITGETIKIESTHSQLKTQSQCAFEAGEYISLLRLERVRGGKNFLGEKK